MFLGHSSVIEEDSSRDEPYLIEASLQGDRDAFSELVVRNQDKLFRAMLRLTRSNELAEDITQDAFVQAFLKLDQFGGRCAFQTWLFRIGFNRFLVLQRKQRSTVSLDKLDEESNFHPVDHGDSAERMCMVAETREEVGDALERLDRESRRILVLREMKGLSYEQISSSLRIKLGTVRSRLSRARSKLLSELQQSPSAVDCL